MNLDLLPSRGLSRQVSGVREISIEALLQWAFGAELVGLERMGDVGDDWNGGGAYGTEWIILQRHLMGATIDGGRGYLPGRVHDDAETVAAVVSASLPRPTAILVADYARSGRRPDPMVGAVPRCVPRATTTNRHGTRAKTVQAFPMLFEGGVWQGWMAQAAASRRAAVRHGLTSFEADNRQHLGHACPVTYEPTRQRIDSARTEYLKWWAALHEVGMRLGGALRGHRLTGIMPPPAPWL